jgi:hypothetical protein
MVQTKMKCSSIILSLLPVCAASYSGHRSLVYASSISIDFEEFNAGDVVSDLGHGITLSALKRDRRKKGPLVPTAAMIFDSADPTGDDFDLGTPNEDLGGPGIGVAGQLGSTYENIDPKGKILIISEDGDTSDSDDNVVGGVLMFLFATPMSIDFVGILDNEEKRPSISLRWMARELQLKMAREETTASNLCHLISRTSLK